MMKLSYQKIADIESTLMSQTIKELQKYSRSEYSTTVKFDYTFTENTIIDFVYRHLGGFLSKRMHNIYRFQDEVNHLIHCSFSCIETKSEWEVIQLKVIHYVIQEEILKLIKENEVCSNKENTCVGITITKKIIHSVPTNYVNEKIVNPVKGKEFIKDVILRRLEDFPKPTNEQEQKEYDATIDSMVDAYYEKKYPREERI